MAGQTETGLSANLLEESGKRELSFEAVIVQFPEEFTAEALEVARAGLNGEPPPASLGKNIPWHRNKRI